MYNEYTKIIGCKTCKHLDLPDGSKLICSRDAVECLNSGDIKEYYGWPKLNIWTYSLWRPMHPEYHLPDELFEIEI